jgi:hypothetical protein
MDAPQITVENYEEYDRHSEAALNAMRAAGVPDDFIALLFRQALAGIFFENLSRICEISIHDPSTAFSMWSKYTKGNPVIDMGALTHGADTIGLNLCDLILEKTSASDDEEDPENVIKFPIH